MKKFSFSLITDTVFTGVCAFFLSLIIAGYFAPYPYNIIFSVCASLIALIFAFKHFYAKQSKKYLSKFEENRFFDSMTALNFMTKDQLYALFSKLFKCKGYDLEKKNSYYYLPQKNALIFIFFGYETPAKKDIVRAFNCLLDGQIAILIGETFTFDAIDFANRFSGKIRLIDGKDVYDGLKELDILPTSNLPALKAPAKTSGKKIANNLLNKKRAKKYFIFGIVFLFLSYFVPIKLYYIICGSIILILSLIVRLFGKEPTP